MDPLARPVLDRLPLAEAVLLVWSWIADASFLQSLFQQYRGRTYEKVIAFPLIVQLIADALLEHGGSANRSFQQAIEHDELHASVQAAYGKLRRLPILLSCALVAGCTDRLVSLFPPAARTTPPKSLEGLAVVIYDGKAIKRVAKRLKPLRGIPGGLLGGRALVALALDSGLVLAMHAHPDGDANDVRFVPALLPLVRQRVPGPRLHMADRQFCDLVQMTVFTANGDHFLLRYHPKVHFHPDPTRPPQVGVDAAGRRYTEAWGWLGSATHKQRRYVRQITLERPGEEAIILVTDLLEAERYPAADLLTLYLARWGIERVFQKVTEVFGLQGLIGGTPQATIFQFAFCLVLYNLIQVVRAYVAQAEQRALDTISLEKLFDDVTEELTAWNKVIEPATTVALFAEPPPLDELQQRLKRLLGGVWTERWIKAPSKPRRPAAKKGKRTHGSVYRILEAHRRQSRSPKRQQ
jgi:DDE family transposase